MDPVAYSGNDPFVTRGEVCSTILSVYSCFRFPNFASALKCVWPVVRLAKSIFAVGNPDHSTVRPERVG
jgi:hypothetical protein